MHKDIQVRSTARELGLWVLFIVCRVLMMTWRVRIVGMDQRRRAIAHNPHGTFIFATFHENAVTGLLSHPGQGIACLTSRSKDGDAVAFVCEHIGLRTVRGSSSRGGKEARDELVDGLRQGISAAITVDGPRGPRRVAKAGIIDAAKKSGAPILPFSGIADRHWVLRKTWDQTRIPKPFARVLVRYGEPMFVPQTIDGQEFEGLQALVSETLAREDEIVRVQFESFWDMGRRYDAHFS